MQSFHSFKRNNPCPVCNSENGGCKQSDDLILCLNERGDVSGYRFIGQSKDGGEWGKFLPTDLLETLDDERRREWQEQREQKRIQQRYEWEARQAESLSADERDKAYRALLSGLTLNPRDRADLTRRGLSDQQIEQHGFKSVEQWQPARNAPLNLPGVLPHGSLNIPEAGYLCPITDIQGRIVGCQVRSHDPQAERKYYWLSSAGKERPMGQSPHLKGSDENPLLFLGNFANTPRIALCEGTGAKPLIAHHRLGLSIIGAAGGNFASGRSQILEAIALAPHAEWVLYADAGWRNNPHIVRQYSGLAELLQQHGIKLLIADWGQWDDKAAGDIDEIENYADIRFHPFSEFAVLPIEPSKGDLLPEREKRKASQEPPKAEYKAFCTQLEEQEQIEALQTARLTETKRDHFKARTERIQAELNSLSSEPTIEAIGRYIPQGLLQLPHKPGIILVDATMGTGKTSTALKGLVQQHRARYPKALEWLFTPRNLLGIQSGAILGLPHHSYSTAYPFQSSSCFESVGAIALDQLPDRAPLILIDEAGQSFKQILDGGTCKDSQPFVLERTRQLFKAVAERGGWIVLSEDGLTNLELDFVKEASGLEVVEHLKFTKEVITPRTFEIYDHASLTWDEILMRLEQGENLLCFTDSRKWGEETERMLAARGIEGCFFVHAGNSQDQWVRDLMKNPTAWVEQNKPRFLGFTPSMGSGVSIDDPKGHFGAMAIHIYHLEPRQGKQGCDRLRTDVPRFGYVKERGSSDDDLFSGSRPDLILRDLRRNKNGIAKLTQFAEYAGSKGADLLAALQRIDEDWDNPESELSFYLKHWSQYKARENYSKLALRENLISIWESQGHTVNLLQLGKVKHLAEERTEHRAALDQDEAIAWAEADTSQTSLTEARDILNTLGATSERRRVARKRLLEDKLPGTRLDAAEFCLKAVIQHNGRFLKSAELLWKAKNPDAAKTIDRWNWSNAFSQSAQTGRIVIIHRLSNHSAQAKLLHECSLQPFIDGKVQQFDNNTTEAIAVHQWALLHNRQFRRHLRITVSENHTPVQTVNKLLRKLGFEIDKMGWKGSREERQRQYRIANLQDCDRNAILKALTERFISRCEEKGETAVIATRMKDLIPTSCDHELENWLTPESLNDVRMMWTQADSEEVRAEIRRFVPMAVLERAIA